MSAELRSRRNVFAGLALDRCSERRPDRAWLEQALHVPETRFIVLDPDGKALLTPDLRHLRELDRAEQCEPPRVSWRLFGLSHAAIATGLARCR